MLKFQTGIYPYSVMTSVFSPTDRLKEREDFAPVKIAFSAQEWCGHVYSKLHPENGRLRQVIYSYFASEGERKSSTKTPKNTLYEDALWIQLRELDGPFADGKSWRGHLVPSVWRTRKRHRKVVAVPATIHRTLATWSGKPVTRFIVKTASFSLSVDVETVAPRRILHWKGSDGEEATLLKTTRLPYWRLYKIGDQAYLSKLGLPSK